MRSPGAVFDDKVFTFNKAVSAQLVHQRIHDANGLEGFSRKGEHHAETVGAAGILRARPVWPRCRRAECGDKISPSHCLTPKLRKSIVAGLTARLEGLSWRRRMSALGQKRTSGHVQSMSALPPKADIGTQQDDVRFVPIADIGCRQMTWLRPSE